MDIDVALWAGLDIGEDSCVLSVIGINDDEVFARTVATDIESIMETLSELAPAKVKSLALEVGNTAVELVRQLRARGVEVMVCETRQVSRYLRVRVNKTDLNDARGLAEIARMGPSKLARVHVKHVETQRVRSKLVFRHRLNLQRIACEGMIRGLVRLNGGRFNTAIQTATFKRNVETALAQLKSERAVDLDEEIRPLFALALSLRALLETLDRKLRTFAESHPVCSKLLEVPGVGPVCAVSFYTAVDDPSRFADSKDVGAYFGLTPRIYQSGKSVRHGRISRRGNKLTRSHLTMSASVILLRCRSCYLKEWGSAVAERAGPGKARVALARRLAVLMLEMWKHDKPYAYFFPPRLIEESEVLPANRGDVRFSADS